MRCRLLHLAVCLGAIVSGFALATAAPAEPTRGVGLLRQPVEFTVGQHGLSYTKEAWDFPGYSVARKLAAAGYAVIAIDRLGYGQSPLQDGYHVTFEAYADMAHQIVEQLRAQGFSHVVLAGHSAGAGVTEFEAGAYGGVDAIMALGWHHRPSNQLGQDFFAGDDPRALQDDYEYFLGTPYHRAEMFYTATADPAVVEADTKAAVPTPSGEILSIAGCLVTRRVVP